MTIEYTEDEIQSNRKEWVKALRSGDYKQGRAKLRKADNTYCCLGVLCDLIDPSGWVEKFDEYDEDGDDEEEFVVTQEAYYFELSNDEFPAQKFLDRVGLRDVDCRLLAHKNDDGATFEDIAKMIESGQIVG